MRHVTTLRVNRLSPVKTNPFPRVSRDVPAPGHLRQIRPRFCLADEKPWPPTRTIYQFIEAVILDL